MASDFLPKRASVEDACQWLHARTSERWTLARILESGVMPWFWLDYKPGYPEAFGSRTEGYLAPMVFQGDVERLSGGRSRTADLDDANPQRRAPEV